MPFMRDVGPEFGLDDSGAKVRKIQHLLLLRTPVSLHKQHPKWQITPLLQRGMRRNLTEVLQSLYPSKPA
jgi:hypothetical protein